MKVSIQRPDQERFIEKQVQAGRYASPEAVVEEAIAYLQDLEGEWTRAQLEREIDQGLESLARGEGLVVDAEGLRAVGEEIKARGRERLGGRTAES